MGILEIIDLQQRGVEALQMLSYRCTADLKSFFSQVIQRIVQQPSSMHCAYQ